MKFGMVALLLFSPTQCLDYGNRDENMSYYQSQLDVFEKTQDPEAICNAASVIGNVQMAFPVSTKQRKVLFIEHIKTGLDEIHKRGLTDETAPGCSSRLWKDLYVLKTAIIRQSREMVKCLDNKRVNGLYTSQAYDSCAAEHNYKP